MKMESSEETEHAHTLIGFLVGDVHYGLDINRVREIIKPLPTLAFPHAPPSVVGVADHRGAVVPVVDMRRRFGLPPASDERSRRWVLVRAGTRYVGLVVDAVTEVFAARPEARRVMPDLGDDEALQALTGVCKHGGHLVFVVDVDRLAAVSEHIDVDAARELLEQRERP